MTQKIQHMQLKENWFIDKDPQNCGEKIGWTSKVSEDALPTEVPSIIQETLPEYHGAAFYWCQFIPNICHTEKDRVILRFNGVDYKATVWLNGTWLGAHESGETPFEFDITEKIHIEQENLLAVKVINPVDYDIDGLNRLNVPNRNKTTQKRAGGCLNSGGIWYDVELFTVPAVYITEKQLIGNSETGDLTARISVKNVLSVAQKAELHLNVYGKTGGNHFIVGNMNSVCVDQGQTLVEISTAVPNHQLWDIDDPFLYRVELVLVSDCGEYRESLNFGFRSFAVKNGYFYLNDRKIFLKSAHSGNAFPIGQNYPVVKEQIRRDMIMAKTYGFNMVCAIAGIFRPEQLDVCDEIGLLIYEEAMAAWQLGEWKQFLKDETRSDTDQEKMFTRFDISTLEMIRRDRNHPSVVVWGLLNEMQTRNPITAYAKNFLAKLRAEDETRLVFIDSGRWDGDRRDASASNPYSSEWDVWMGADGTDYDLSTEELRPYFWPNVGDYHYYPDFPISEKDAEHIRNYAHSVQPAFISESGIGPLFNVIEEAKQFQQHGCREDLEDFSWLTKQSRALEADWHRLGLEKVYPFPEMMLKESQRLSAQDRRFLFDLIRSNPKHNGYSLTGLLDHGMCGEGL